MSERLAQRAHDILTERLAGYGNKLSEQHSEALMRIIGTCSLMAYGQKQGRYCYGLATGAGKSESIIAVCQAIDELATGHSLAIAAGKIEALCTIYKKLIEAGISADKIGLVHTKRYDADKAERFRASGDDDPAILGNDFASLPATEGNDNRPFLLVSHNHIRSPKAGNLEIFDRYRGKPRSLVIWDESLITSTHQSINKADLQSGVGCWRPYVRPGTPHAVALAYLDEALATIEAELDCQLKGHKAKAIRLPERSDIEIAEYERLLPRREGVAPLRDLLRMAQRDLRVLITDREGAACVRYEITVPRALKNIVVLDASYPIRQLQQMDRTIQSDPGFKGDIKRYDHVTIRHLRHASGRSKMSELFGMSARADRKVSAEIARVIREDIPQTEGVIIFTFKASESKRPVDFKSILRRDMEAAGINLGTSEEPRTIPVRNRITGKIDNKPRIVFLTWGMETSLSKFAYCTNVLFAGVLHRGHVDLAGAIVGQRDNLTGDVEAATIRNVERSEVAHSLYQAMSRGSCRDTHLGQALPMNAWLIHHDREIKAELDKVMPGAVWENWEGEHLKPYGGKTEALITLILSHLRTLPEGIDKVSTTSIKRAIDVSGYSRETFTDAVQALSNHTDNGWSISGRSLVRGASSYGF